MYIICKPYRGIKNIKRVLDGASIPVDYRNNDYKEYLKWIEAGNIPEDEQIIEDNKQKLLIEKEKLENIEKEKQELFNNLPEQEKEIVNIIPETKENRTDDELLLDSIRLNRFKEYPSILECIEAIMENMEGRPEKLLMVQSKREFVRNKYPKPLSMQLGGK